MIKQVIYKFIKYFFGIDIRGLLSSVQLLQSKVNSLQQDNAELQQKIDLTEIQLGEKENEYIIQSGILKKVNSENAEIILNKAQLLTSIQTLELKYKENEQLTHKLSLENEALTEKLQTAEDKIHLIQGKLNIAESKSTKQIVKISDLQDQIKVQNTDISDRLEMIRSLKEEVSQLQSNAVNYKIKDEVIQNLQSSIENGNKKIGNLQSDLDRINKDLNKYRTPEITHSEQSATKYLKKVDGVVIVHKGLNIGNRTENSIENEVSKFEYLGEFMFYLRHFGQKDSENFPDTFYPRLNTPILKWQEAKSNTTTGVAEPLLVDAIKAIKEYVPDIEILQNVSLSIRNRDYSYRPDIALFWEKHNLCIDIEIDEPYDMVSRKPLHYKGSSDYLRNLYFVSQGWIVIRFSEEQVFKNTMDCMKYVTHILKKITADARFDDLLENFTAEYSPRWDFEKAKEYAIENYREGYLNIEAVGKMVDLDSTLIEDPLFIVIHPAEDILTDVEYPILDKKLSENQKRYIRITKGPFEEQLIFENFRTDKQNYHKGISGFDLVKEKNTFVPFDRVIDIEGIDSPFKYPLYNSPGNTMDEKLNLIVKDAIYCCNPIRIEYVDTEINMTFRNIAMICYRFDSEENLADKIWTNYYHQKTSRLGAYCMLKKAQMPFYIERIQSIQVFDLHHFGTGHILAFSGALWYPLKKNDFQLCEHISSLLPSYMIETDLVLAGNLAHFLLLSGKKDKAIEIYRKFDRQMVSEELGWREAILQDFKELNEVADYKERFDEAINLLGWSENIAKN